jgi:hypothetical protein
MMRKIRSAARKVVRVEEGKGIHQNCSHSRRYQQGDNGMACSMAAILDERTGDWMLGIEDRRFSSSSKISITYLLG